MKLPAIVLVALLVAAKGLAAPVKGPSVAVEQVAPVALVPEDVTPKPDLEVRRRRYEANLMAPVPVRVLGGMFVLKADFFKEQRELTGADAGPLPDDLKNPNVAGLGGLFLPHAAEGAPRFFLLAARYGEMSFEDDAR